MSTIAMRRSNVLAMTPIQRRALRIITEKLQLGDPVEYKTGGGVVWYVFDDDRISLLDAAVLARFAAGVANTPDVQTRQELYDWLQATIVLPRDVVINRGDDPWAKVLLANNAPAVLQAGEGIPASLTPVDV